MFSMDGSENPLNALYAEYLPQPTPVAKTKKKKLTGAEKRELKLKEEQDFQITEMRELLRREYEMSQRTALAYRQRWENMCREIKLKEMKKELEDWEQKVTRIIKQKDEQIERILEDISLTKEIHKKSFSAQVQMMDFLIDILKTFQETSRILYENEVSELLHDFYREVDERKAYDETVKIKCENMADANVLVVQQELSNDLNTFLDQRDDCVNTEIEKRYRFRDDVIKKMKDLHKQLQDFLNSLISSSLDVQKYEHINYITERQRNFLRESVRLNHTESRSLQISTELQRHLAQEERVGKRKLNDLKLEHAYFCQMRKNIENDMKLNRLQTHEKLKIITSESFQVTKKLQKQLKFGELLLGLAANCRKFQTESEKVLPWGDFQEPSNQSATDTEPFQLKTLDLKEHVDKSEAELHSNAQLMKNFWRRQAIVEAEIVLLEKQKLQLQKQNQKYIETIKSLSKTDNVEELKKTLHIENVLEKYIF